MAGRILSLISLALLSVAACAQTVTFANGPGGCSYDNQSGINCEDVQIVDANGKPTGYWLNFFIVNAPNGQFTNANFWMGTYTPNDTVITDINAYLGFGGTVTLASKCVPGNICIIISGSFVANPQYPGLYQSGTVTEDLTIHCTARYGCRPEPYILEGSGTLSH